MSKDLTGIVVAVGNSVPELTTTMLSFSRHGVKMTEFGIASNIGCALFTITIVPAVAILATSFGRGKESSTTARLGAVDKDCNQVLMMTIFRDLGFFLLALVLYDLILYKGLITFTEAVFLAGLTLLYIASIAYTNRLAGSRQKMKNDGNIEI